MKLQMVGGLAGLTCAATYVFGFAVLIALLAPLGYGAMDVDTQAVVGLIDAKPGLLILWNTVIYILNALALAVLVVAVHSRLHASTPDLANVTCALGLIWGTLVLGAGMIANVAVEQAAYLAPIDMDRAVTIWETLHAVELGLGGGNEIAGGVWIGLVSIAGLIGHSLGKITIGLGLLTGVGGVLTLIPVLGDTAGAVFGLGALVWFIAIGCTLVLKRSQPQVNQAAKVEVRPHDTQTTASKPD